MEAVMKIGIFGAGKLSGAIAEEVRQAKSGSGAKPEIVWVVDQGDTVPHLAVDVAIDASTGSAVREHIEWAVKTGIPLVVAATGWSIPNLPELVSDRTGLLVAPNMSIGVAFMKRMSSIMALLADLDRSGELSIFEHHHSQKKDAPSGTAISLANACVQASSRYKGWTAGPAEPFSISVVSLRSGAEPGYHQILFDSPLETLTLSHRARDRRVFAKGALVACSWILGKKGVFSMDDIVESLIREGGVSNA